MRSCPPLDRCALPATWPGRNAVRPGETIDIACLKIGPAYVLHMPGELFVEYQLAAQKMRPDSPVLMAAYGDYGPGYIGTAIAYTQGGYETGPRVARRPGRGRGADAGHARGAEVTRSLGDPATPSQPCSRRATRRTTFGPRLGFFP